MSDFSQNGIISNLHDFGTKSTKEIEIELKKFSKERKMELILPSLYSELEADALPKIVDEISKTNPNSSDILLNTKLDILLAKFLIFILLLMICHFVSFNFCW